MGIHRINTVKTSTRGTQSTSEYLEGALPIGMRLIATSASRIAPLIHDRRPAMVCLRLLLTLSWPWTCLRMAHMGGHCATQTNADALCGARTVRWFVRAPPGTKRAQQLNKVNPPASPQTRLLQLRFGRFLRHLNVSCATEPHPFHFGV